MAAYRFESRLDGDPDPVFAYLVDPARRAEWDPAVANAEILTKGPLRVGSQLRLRRRMFVRAVPTTVMVVEVTGTEKRYSERFVDGPLRGSRTSWQVTMTGWGSRVAVLAEMELSGGLRLVAPLVHRRLRRNLSRSLGRLRRRFKR
jgi:hypothetical protein